MKACANYTLLIADSKNVISTSDNFLAGLHLVQVKRNTFYASFWKVCSSLEE
jgi:hypothetical protein